MFFQGQRLTAIQQWLNIRSIHADAVGGAHRGLLDCKLWLQPTSMSRAYLAHVMQREFNAPKVWIEQPSLTTLAEGRRIPHLYDHVLHQLCLYHPKKQEWAPRMPISKTVIPWTSLWLFYFEDWLVSGEWHGGGEHPPSKKSPD